MRNSQSEPSFTAIDLFCGVGAVTAALRASGFSVLAAVDNDPIACRSFRANHPDTNLVERDIHRIDPRRFAAKLPAGKQLDVLVVCAPCQPFSAQNHNRGTGDPREDLIFQAARFAEVLNPRVIFFENVAGLAAPRFHHILTALSERLAELGYKLSKPHRIDAAEFGVPQRRIRCVMVATKSGRRPRVGLNKFKKTRRSVRDAISDLNALSSGERDESDNMHFARFHSDINLTRLSLIPADGGSRDSLPVKYQLACHRGYRGHPDVYGRMAWDAVAPTLTTGCTDITRGRFAHPDQNRAITLREAARLQSFPDEYVFCGNSGEIARQIGNAVPYLMMKQLATYLRKMIPKTRN